MTFWLWLFSRPDISRADLLAFAMLAASPWPWWVRLPVAILWVLISLVINRKLFK